MSWVLLTYKLPSNNSSARVAVWREVRRSGALHVQRSVVAFPEHDAFRRAVERFRVLVAEVGGETLAVRAEPFGELDATKLTDAWNEARSAEYTELRGECGKFLTEIEHEFDIEKFTLAELEEEEAELEKLERWHERIDARDIHAAPGAEETKEALAQARESLERYSSAVFQRTQL
jgi:Protein ChrB, N-terminal